MVKNLLVNPGEVRDAGSISEWQDPLEKEMATHSMILTLKATRREEPGGL